jgi:hypothetical protein
MVLDIHFYFNVLGSEATSLFPAAGGIGRSFFPRSHAGAWERGGKAMMTSMGRKKL